MTAPRQQFAVVMYEPHETPEAFMARVKNTAATPKSNDGVAVPAVGPAAVPLDLPMLPELLSMLRALDGALDECDGEPRDEADLTW